MAQATPRRQARRQFSAAVQLRDSWVRVVLPALLLASFGCQSTPATTFRDDLSEHRSRHVTELINTAKVSETGNRSALINTSQRARIMQSPVAAVTRKSTSAVSRRSSSHSSTDSLNRSQHSTRPTHRTVAHHDRASAIARTSTGMMPPHSAHAHAPQHNAYRSNPEVRPIRSMATPVGTVSRTGNPHAAHSPSLPHMGHSVPTQPPVVDREGNICQQCAHTSGIYVPRENSLVSTGPYIVQPPDILIIELVNPIPRPPYRFQPGDVISILVGGVPETTGINGEFGVQPDGMISIGEYGRLSVLDLTVEELNEVIAETITERFSSLKPVVQAQLVSSPPSQVIAGQHLIRPDGTIGLGTYGSLHVRGMTLEQVQRAIEQHLSTDFLDPKVSVDVMAYNSSWYYVITDNGGAGEQILRLPYTGSDTVLDAISLVGGVSTVSDKDRIWIARTPPYAPCGRSQILEVAWKDVVERGDASTNFQIMPSDRIYIDSDKVVEFDTVLARLISPIERVMGIILLGSTTSRSLSGDLNRGF